MACSSIQASEDIHRYRAGLGVFEGRCSFFLLRRVVSCRLCAPDRTLTNYLYVGVPIFVI